MPGPLVAGVASGALGAGIGVLAGMFAKPLEHVQGSLGNYALPINMPLIDAIIAGYQRGLLTPLQAYKAAARTGVMFDPERVSEPRIPPLNVERAIWDAVSDLQWIRPYPAICLDAYARGIIGRDRAKSLVVRAGGKWDDWSELLAAFYSWPPMGMVMEARNRGYLPNVQEFNRYLGHLGIGSGEALNLVDKMREAIPSVSDLIHMQVREVFSIDIANAWRLYDEFPTPIEPWLHKIGYFGGPEDIVTSDGQQRRLSWPLAYWASHWQPISPTQNYEMMYRLRPGRVGVYSNRLQALTGQAPNLVAWDMQKVREWLRIQDYTPGIRDNLAAISFRLPRLIDLRQAFRLGALNPAQLREQLLDRGHPNDDADWLVDLFRRQEDRRLQGPIDNLQRSLMTRNFKAILCLYESGFNTTEVTRAFLREADVPQQTAELATNVIDLEIHCKQLREVINRLRRDFLSGTIGVGQARESLTAAGVKPVAVEDHLRQWRLLLTTRRKQLTSEQILRLLKKGFIGLEEAQTRLGNLGWAATERLPLTSEAIGDMLRNQAIFRYRELRRSIQDIRRAAQEGERTARRQVQERLNAARRLEQVQRRAETLARRTQADLRRIIPLGKLLRWYAREYIDDDFFTQHLTAQGYTPEAILGYLQEARDERAKQREHAGSNGQSGPAAGGGP